MGSCTWLRVGAIVPLLLLLGACSGSGGGSSVRAFCKHAAAARSATLEAERDGTDAARASKLFRQAYEEARAALDAAPAEIAADARVVRDSLPFPQARPATGPPAARVPPSSGDGERIDRAWANVNGFSQMHCGYSFSPES